MLIARLETGSTHVYELQSDKLHAAKKEAMGLAKPMTSKIVISSANSWDSENQIDLAIRYQDCKSGKWSGWQS